MTADALSRQNQNLRTLKQRQKNERVMAIFECNSRLQTIEAIFGTRAKLALIGRIEEATAPPLPFSVLLANKGLKANSEIPKLEIYRQKASDTNRPWPHLENQHVLYRDRLLVSASDFL